MNKQLIFLSIYGRIHFTKMLCQEKEQYGCQLSPFADSGKKLLTNGKEMMIPTVMVLLDKMHQTSSMSLHI